MCNQVCEYPGLGAHGQQWDLGNLAGAAELLRSFQRLYKEKSYGPHLCKTTIYQEFWCRIEVYKLDITPRNN